MLICTVYMSLACMHVSVLDACVAHALKLLSKHQHNLHSVCKSTHVQKLVQIVTTHADMCIA